MKHKGKYNDFHYELSERNRTEISMKILHCQILKFICILNKTTNNTYGFCVESTDKKVSSPQVVAKVDSHLNNPSNEE